MKKSTKIILFRVSGRFYVFFEEEEIRKTVNLDNGKFSFSEHFSKLSSRPQVELINIHENLGVFIFDRLPDSMRYMLSICNFMFRKSIKHYFGFQFLTSYSVWYPCVQKLHRVPYLAFGTNVFLKLTSGESLNMAESVNDVMRIETSLVAVSS